METLQYRVAWRRRNLGETRRGKPMAREAAEAWVSAMNAEYPDLDHWIEPA